MLLSATEFHSIKFKWGVMRRPEDVSKDRAGAGAQYIYWDSKLLVSII